MTIDLVGMSAANTCHRLHRNGPREGGPCLVHYLVARKERRLYYLERSSVVQSSALEPSTSCRQALKQWGRDRLTF